MSNYEDNNINIIDKTEAANILFTVLELEKDNEIKNIVLEFLNKTLPLDPIERFVFLSNTMNESLNQEIVLKTFTRLFVSLTSIFIIKSIHLIMS